MAKQTYPKVPWRTDKDPIAGHPRAYEGFDVKHEWYTKQSPEGSYRSIVKW